MKYNVESADASQPVRFESNKVIGDGKVFNEDLSRRQPPSVRWYNYEAVLLMKMQSSNEIMPECRRSTILFAGDINVLGRVDCNSEKISY